MKKFVPFEKLSKKKQKELNKAKRTSWDINPVTRRERNPRAYDRNKLRSEKSETEFVFFCIKHVFQANIPVIKHERRIT